jgi:hypothetical protein
MAAIRATALASLELLRRDPEVRLAALVLLVEGINMGWSESPPPFAVSPQVSALAAAEFVAAGPSPAKPTPQVPSR